MLIANSNRPQQIQITHSKLQINRRLRLSAASGATRLKIFVIYEPATLESLRHLVPFSCR